MEILLTCFYTLLLSFVVFKSNFFKSTIVSKKYLLSFFWLKIIAGLCLYFIYTYYYPDRQKADIFRYFNDAQQIYKALPQHPLDYIQMIFGINIDNQYFYDNYFVHTNHWDRILQGNIVSDSHFLIRFNAIILLFSFGYFNVHTVFAAFVSFIGQMGLCHFVENNFKSVHIGHILSIFIIPSVVFWSSNVLKEFLLVFGIGIFIYATDKLFFYTKTIQQKLWMSVLIIIACKALIFTKIYVFCLLFILLLPFVFIKKYHLKKVFVCYFITILFFSFCGWIFVETTDKNIINTLVYKHNDMLNLAIAEHAQITEIQYLQADFIDIFTYLPIALLNVLFRPLPFEGSSLMIRLAETEQIFLLICAVSILILGFQRNKQPAQKNLFWFCFIFALCNAIIIGLATPILGAIIRYRSIGLPFVFLSLWLLCDKNTIKHRFHKIQTLFKTKKK
ncbi:MAG: hypothetical protein J5606_02970 [Bacteroidales bacterium]|nr:hypothetical protein [Bacteroidales bacterium]